ncbi:autotransporter outer membrane beta-barrel domain-containing protein [Comamonadaceae bacterium OTU4NAUVB1]|nr:autotransporter outer membrane beta-barrel domain-containing protein [Comamonadaceae bacterium OTU4NAUVB1]
MNKSYRSVWNQALGAWVAISEVDRAGGHGRGLRSALVLAGALVAAVGAGAQGIDYVDGQVRADAIAVAAGTTQVLNVAVAGAEAGQTGPISGAGGIVKTGAGTLVLGRDAPAATSANTYAGGTVLDAGTLAVTHAGSLGTGTLTINGGTLRGGVTLANDVVVRGDFTVAPLDRDSTPAAAQRSLRLDGDVRLESATTPTLRFVSPASSVTYLLEMGGVVSGTRGLTIEAPTSARYWGDLDFVGGKSNTYTGLTTVQGSTVLGLARTGGATSIAGDLLVQGVSSVALLQSEQIADTATVTVRSQGFELIHPVTGESVRLPGMVFLRPGLTETVGALYGDGTVVLGSSTLRTGAGDFSGTVSDAGVPGVAADGRIVKYGPGVFTLSGANRHSGGTTVEGGTLRVANDGALGTGGLALAGGTTLDYDTTRVARIDNAITLSGTATLNVDAGSVRQSGAIGERGGRQGLIKSGAGTLELTAANAFSGGTDLRAGLIDLQTTAALGTGAVRVAPGAGLRVGAGATMADTRVANAGFVDVSRAGATAIGSLDGAGDVRLGGATLTLGGLNLDDAIAGAIRDGGVAGGTGGAIVKRGTGTLVLSGANGHTGATAIDAGTLKAGAAYTLSAASAHAVATGATLDLAGLSQRVASLSNGGTVSVLGAAPGTDLTVTGAYVGNGGTLRLGTALGTSASVSDRLVLDGANASASGRTTVQVTNLGGLGAPTTGNGIEVVAARNGATTTAQTTRSAFALAGGHVDAGAYAYTLHAADAGGAGESWYLRSTAPAVVTPPVATPPPSVTTPTTTPTTPTTPVPTPVTTPATPTTPVAPTTGASQDSTLSATVRPGPAAPAGAPVPSYRAEVPLFAALPQQLRQADLAMLGNLHQRIGDEPAGRAAATGTATDADGRRRSAWGRVISTRIDVRQQGTVDPSSRGRVDGFQAGADLFAAGDWRAGVYVGQLDGRVATSGFAGGTRGGVGANDLRSRYLGAYGTYMNASGFYADAVLQAGDHRVNAEPLGNATAPVRGDSVLASIEAGQSFALGRGWRVEPQVQLIHQRIDLDDTALSGATVRHDAGNGWIARVGVRLKGEVTTAAGPLWPYARVNVYGASHGTDIARFAGPAAATDIATRTGGTWAEAAVGGTLALGRTWSVYGEAGRLASAGGDTRVKSGVQGSVGVKARW